MKKMILTLIGTAFPFLFSGCTAESASIGIIGGADGPTAVLVSGSFGRGYFVLGGLLLAAIIITIIKRHKK